MRIRKHAGIGLGLILTLVVAATAVASTIGPNHITNESPGWNSEIFDTNVEGTTTFSIRNCQSSASSVEFDLMHHWPFFPSTGTEVKTLTCANNGTWRNASWDSEANVDYSVEYCASCQTASITLDYKIVYPTPN